MQEVFKADTIGTLNFAIESFIENHEVYEYGDVTIIIELVTLPDSHYWKATLTPKDTASALKDALVEEHGYVDFFVSSEEIRAVATDMQRELTDDELANVVKFLSHNDLETGLCEVAIEGAISEICPDATDQEWEEDSDNEEDESDGIDLERSAWDIVENNFTPDQH